MSEEINDGASTEIESVSGVPEKHNYTNVDDSLDHLDQRLSRLEKLKCWDEVQALMSNSVSPMKIARFIQNERHEYTDVALDSLRTVIHKYIKKKEKDFAESQINQTHMALMDSMDERINPLDALNLLFAIQMDRVMMTFQKEKQIDLGMKSNTENLRLAKEIARTMAHIENSDVLAKIRGRSTSDSSAKSAKDVIGQTEKIKNVYVNRYGEAATEIMMDPGKRRKLLSAMDRIRKNESGPLKDLLEKKFLAKQTVTETTIEVTQREVPDGDSQQ